MFYRTWIKPSQLKVFDTFSDSHWERFEKVRQKHNLNICEETNKLVLRLDKIMEKPNLDKSLVEWTSDELVKLCPYCANSFNFARRRHHCRVCGAILCSNCSRFLDYRAACKLVKPSKLYTDPYDRIQDKLESMSTEDGPKLRTCEDCKRLLDKRVQIIEDHYSQPLFLNIYEELRKNMSQADELILCLSSASGDRDNDATILELKTKIRDIRQNIISISAKIKKLAEQEQSDKQAYLQRSIAQSVVYWLTESVECKIVRSRSSSARQARDCESNN